ncbi:MAG: hypothetical protein KBC98_02575 [Candidatus Pacebacteria bacterium]|nr:hypothetical protein [Candidatus Paceibacterota bacterium]
MKQQPGIIALITVLITGAIVLIIGLGMAERSMLELNTSLDEELSHQALTAATSCMERALLSLAGNASYAGNETLSVGTNTCSIATITTSGITRTVKTSSTVQGYTRRLQVTVSNVNPPLQVSSWQEVSS